VTSSPAAALPLTLLGAVVLVVGFDVVAAWATRNHGQLYRRLWPVQFGLYVIVGFAAMLATLDLRSVEIVGAITGFLEATLGWALTWRMGPGRVDKANAVSIGSVIVSMTAFGFGLAIVGALLFNVTARVLMHAR
jgi:hypothetical protein